MKNLKKNQRGGALVYVLFAIALLLLLTPPLLNMVMSRTTSDKALGNQLAASQLSSSAMESFFTYLNASGANGITKNTWNGYISGYPGWTGPAGTPLTLPDGSKMTVCQIMCTDKECSNVVQNPKSLPSEIDTELTEYYVKVRAVAGDTDGNLQANEKYAKAQELVRAFPINKKGAAVIVDPDTGERSCLNKGQSGILYGDTTNQSGTQKNESIGQIISAHLDQQEQKTQAMVTNYTYLTQGETCESFTAVTACTITQIQNMYQYKKARTTGPIYIKAKRLIFDPSWKTDIGTLGEPGRPLILILESLDTTGLTANIYGNLVVTGNAVLKNNLEFQIHRGLNAQGNPDFGGLFVMGSLTLSSMSANFTAEGTLYCGQNLSFVNGNFTINAKSVTVIGALDSSSASFTLNTNGGIVSLGSLDFSSGSYELNAVNGDLYVERDVYSSSTSTRISVGGVAAVGGNLQMTNGSNAITASGQNSTLYLPGVTGDCLESTPTPTQTPTPTKKPK